MHFSINPISYLILFVSITKWNLVPQREVHRQCIRIGLIEYLGLTDIK
jgi:hypothetical protein